MSLISLSRLPPEASDSPVPRRSDPVPPSNVSADLPFPAAPDPSNTLPAGGSGSHRLLHGYCKSFFPYRLPPDSPDIALSVLFCPCS